MRFVIYVALMAGTTYLVRMLPFVLFRRRIRSRFFRSLLYYIPYAVLAAMTIPGIFSSTGDTASAAVGTVVAVVLAYRRKSLIVVAMAACAAALLCSLVI